MNKLIASILVLSCAGLAFANDGIAHSSFTLTNDTALLKSDTSTNTIVHCLTAIVVSTPSGVAATLKVFNSSFTTAVMSTAAIISLSAVGVYSFSDIQLKGIVYQTSGNTSGVNIIYKQ